MIVHAAPRKVFVTSELDPRQGDATVSLDSVLAVDFVSSSASQVDLVVRLTTGKLFIAGRYSDRREAERDRARLRLLAGLRSRQPARPGTASVMPPVVPRGPTWSFRWGYGTRPITASD